MQRDRRDRGTGGPRPATTRPHRGNAPRDRRRGGPRGLKHGANTDRARHHSLATVACHVLRHCGVAYRVPAPELSPTGLGLDFCTADFVFVYRAVISGCILMLGAAVYLRLSISINSIKHIN